MPCHLVITRSAAACVEPTRRDSGRSEKSAKTWGVEQPASALMESSVCHPQCRSMTGKRVEVSEGFKMLQRGGRWKGKCIRSDCELEIL